MKRKAQRETGSLLDNNAIRENALLNVETLRNSELVLADLIKQNRLHVVGGLYDLATGPEWKVRHMRTDSRVGAGEAADTSNSGLPESN